MPPDFGNPGVIVAYVFWLTIPAMAPNLFAAIIGGGAPMDGGKTWRGKRILGPGKTWRGFVGGVLAGTLIGSLQIVGAHKVVPWPEQADIWGFGPMPYAFLVVFTLALGSLLGDAAGSFIKRRMGIERGKKAPLMDQWGFLISAWGLTALVHFHWFYEYMVQDWLWLGMIYVLIIVLALHRLMNIVGYLLKQKEVPW